MIADFNNRIIIKLDFIVEDRKDFDFVPESYKLDTFMKNRNNEDISLKNFKKN